MAKLNTIDTTNYYPDCKGCGSCCHLTIICMDTEEVSRIKNYMAVHDIIARDLGSYCCPFLMDNQQCAVYPVRSQTCRLYNCKVPRKQLLDENPDIIIDDQKPLFDLRQTFIYDT